MPVKQNSLVEANKQHAYRERKWPWVATLEDLSLVLDVFFLLYSQGAQTQDNLNSIILNRASF